MSAKTEHMNAVALRQVEEFFKQDYPMEIYEELLQEKLGRIGWEDDDIETIICLFKEFAEIASVETDSREWNESEN